MRLLLHLAPIAGLFARALASTSSAGNAATSITLYLPASPNPFTLASRTHATLSSLDAHHTAPLTAVNTFVFRNVTPGSYLLNVHCPSDAFRPLRVDVSAPATTGDDEVGGGAAAGAGAGAGAVTVAAWETFRGNDWGNKGEALASVHGSVGDGFTVRHLGVKNYFVERPAFSVFTILKNPMILMGAVSMLIFVGMPYLMDNTHIASLTTSTLAVDPEMKAEFEEQQRKGGPMAAIMGGGGGGGGQSGGKSLGEFDMAGFLAGSKKKGGATDGAAADSSGKAQGARR